MIIVAGHLLVDPADRERYLRDCIQAMEQAAAAEGCLDFRISADLVDPARINILERWAGQEQLERFRGSGPSDDQATAIVGGSVAEYDVTGERVLF